MVAVASLRSPGSSQSQLIAIPYWTYRHEPGYGVAQPFACDVLPTLKLVNGTYGRVVPASATAQVSAFRHADRYMPLWPNVFQVSSLDSPLGHKTAYWSIDVAASPCPFGSTTIQNELGCDPENPNCRGTCQPRRSVERSMPSSSEAVSSVKPVAA